MPTVMDSMPGAHHDAGYKYDWSAIFDGQVHLFTPGEVPSTPRNFAKQVRAAAMLRSLRVKIVVRGTEGVYVQRLSAT